MLLIELLAQVQPINPEISGSESTGINPTGFIWSFVEQQGVIVGSIIAASLAFRILMTMAFDKIDKIIADDGLTDAERRGREDVEKIDRMFEDFDNRKKRKLIRDYEWAYDEPYDPDMPDDELYTKVRRSWHEPV